MIKYSEYRGSFGLYMRLPKMDKELESYKSKLTRYEKDHADIFELTDRPDPSFPDFAAKVNKNTNFIILDHGYIKLPKK